jgi:RNA polymerase sigma-70 factor (ECF subfamily)
MSLFRQAHGIAQGYGVEQSELARFESVVLPHLDAAYALARYLMRSVADAEDVVQEACLRALKGFTGFRGEPPQARAWLLTIVRNSAYTWRKREAGPERTEFDEAQHSAHVAHEHPESDALKSDRRATLERALNQLAPEFREAIVLREMEGLSYKEISDVAGVPVGTVMSRLSRARDKLAEALRGAEER